MKLLILVFLVLALSPDTNAQQKGGEIAFNVTAVNLHTTVSRDNVFYVVDEMPVFICKPYKDCLKKWLSANAVYPEKALTEDLQGKVFVSFTVQKDGSVSDVRITGSSSPLFEEETIKLFNRMPLWKPGIKDGHPVAVRVNDFCMRYTLR